MEFRNTTLASLSVDGRGSYGIGASAVERSDNLYTYLRITDIRDDGTLNMADLKSVDDAKASQYLLRPNDIVFARTGASLVGIIFTMELMESLCMQGSLSSSALTQER